MTEEELKQFLEDNNEAIKAQVKQKLIDGLISNHSWSMSKEISEIVNDFIKTEIAPVVRAHLQDEKGAIIEAAVKAASGIGDLLAKTLVEQASKNISGNSYQFRNTLKALFD